MRVPMKKVVFLLVEMFALSWATVAFGAPMNSNSHEATVLLDNMPLDPEAASKAEETLARLIEQHPELSPEQIYRLAAKKVAYPTYQTLFNQIADNYGKQESILRKQMMDTLTQNTIQLTDIRVGDDFSTTSANDGNHYAFAGDSSVESEASHDLSDNKGEVYHRTDGAGTHSANGFAWTGYRFGVTGFTTRRAQIEFTNVNGAGYQRAECAFGASARQEAWISLRVFDLTTGTLVLDETADYNLVRCLGTEDPSGEIDYVGVTQASGLVDLVAGHEYIAYLMVRGDAYSTYFGISQFDAADGGLGDPSLGGSISWGTLDIQWQ